MVLKSKYDRYDYLFLLTLTAYVTILVFAPMLVKLLTLPVYLVVLMKLRKASMKAKACRRQLSAMRPPEGC